MQIKRLIFIMLVGITVVIPAFGQLPMNDVKTNSQIAENKSGEHVVRAAMKYLGVRYRKGASGPKYFDCSGFTRFVFRQKNVPLTHSSRSQYSEGTPIKEIADLKPGDLVFFSGSHVSKTVGHVGIVKEVNAESNDFSFVHASRTGVKVDVMSSAYYKKRYIGARRVL